MADDESISRKHGSLWLHTDRDGHTTLAGSTECSTNNRVQSKILISCFCANINAVDGMQGCNIPSGISTAWFFAPMFA